MITHIVSDWLFSPCCVEHQDEFIFERVAVAYSRDYNEVGRAQIKQYHGFLRCILLENELCILAAYPSYQKSKIKGSFFNSPGQRLPSCQRGWSSRVSDSLRIWGSSEYVEGQCSYCKQIIANKITGVLIQFG